MRIYRSAGYRADGSQTQGESFMTRQRFWVEGDRHRRSGGDADGGGAGRACRRQGGRVRRRQPQERARRVNAACEGRGRRGGDDLLCGELGAGQADRGRRAGRRLHLGRPRLDEISLRQEADQAGHRSASCSATSIVLVAPKDSKAEDQDRTRASTSPSLLGDGKLAMGDVKAVPAGKYGKAALESLGVWASVEGKVAQAENVRAALELVSTGEAPLGIVYQTDAACRPGRQGRRHLPGGFASADHLSGRRRRPIRRTSRYAGLPEVPAVRQGQASCSRSRASRC